MARAKLPLDGIRVLDTCVVWAGPYAAQLLSDWGAEVIHVESIQRHVDMTRGMVGFKITKDFAATLGPLIGGFPNRDPKDTPQNRSGMFNSYHRNRLSCTMDLNSPKGVEIFKRLIEKSDIFIENNLTDTMKKHGIGYEALKEIKPDIIMISMPGFGNTGPFAYYRALGAHLENYSGHSMLRGYRDTDPSVTTTTYHCDASAGATLAFTAIMALHHRNRTGKGQWIDIGQIETIIPQLGQAVMDYSMNSRVQETLGNRHTSAAPHECYQCKGDDRWLNISVFTDEQWQGLCRAMGNPEWTKDKQFADALSRHQNQDELNKHMREWTIQHDHYELFHLLQKEGVPSGPVMDDDDCYSDLHLIERGYFNWITHRDTGTFLHPGIAGKMSKMPNNIRRAAPCMGEHNEYVYKEVIGASDEEYDELVREQHIGDTWLAFA